MFLSFPFSFGFSLLCVVGSLFAVSSSHWLGVWLGLEINLMGFIPLMIQGYGGQSVESAIKYFVVQALGSGLILLGGFCMGDGLFFWFLGSYNMFLFFSCFVGLCLKLGVAPLHWWVPSVMGGLSWVACGILLTWQKFAPFLVLGGLSYSFFFYLLFLGFVSSFVGGVLGVGQVQLRLLMAYSSIGHWGWLLSLLSVSLMSSMFYYFFYFLLSGAMFYFLHVSGSSRMNQVKVSGIWFVLIGFLSMGGLPPLSGFVMKVVGVQGLLLCQGYLWLSGLILGSLLSLFYYLSFVFVLFLSVDWGWSVFGESRQYVFVSVCCVIFLMGLPFYEIFFYLV